MAKTNKDKQPSAAEINAALKSAKPELITDAEALVAKIKAVPGYDKNLNLLYALREAGNLKGWLQKA